jgi:hypothetical protein
MVIKSDYRKLQMGFTLSRMICIFSMMKFLGISQVLE